MDAIILTVEVLGYGWK